jgi:hypothetical protein
MRTLHVVLVGALAALAPACGKVGPPLPPITRVAPRPSPLRAVQVGDLIRLSWSAPHLDLRSDEASSVRRADIYRLRQGRDVPPHTIPDEFEESANIVGFIDYDGLKAQLRDGDRLTFEDQLNLDQTAVLANTRFQYAVRYVDGRGRPQPLSNIVSVEPVPGIARPPTDLAYAETQDEVTVTWTPPDENIDGTTPAQVIGYNVYRASPGAERLGRPLNDQPLQEPRYVDRNFRYGQRYAYVVRSVSQGPEQQVESVDSPRLEVTPRDVFRPSTPSNVTVASAGGVVSLFWPTNPERDVVGYYVYRTEGEPGESSAWTRLTQSPYARTTYRDERVRVGARYGYRLTAVDSAGNESPPSAAVAETASP